VFVGIFAYCLVVLRTLRAGDDAFVPSLAVIGGLLLAFVGIAVLIYFIHHIATSIQAAHILEAVASETLAAIDRLFPDGVGEDEGRAVTDLPEGPWHPVAATRSGYLQSVDTEGLMAFAEERNTVVRMEAGIGQFVIEGTPIVSLLSTAPGEKDARRLAAMFVAGPQRTPEQDAAFGIRQIVDVALKALSPGVNDTTTAVMCVDRLTALLLRLTGRSIAPAGRGKDGALRLIARGPTYAQLVAEALDQIRQNAGGNVAVLDALLASLTLLRERARSAFRRHALEEHLQAVQELARRSVPAPRDRQRLEERARRMP
jgi:uncharacterized membrane protein